MLITACWKSASLPGKQLHRALHEAHPGNIRSGTALVPVAQTQSTADKPQATATMFLIFRCCIMEHLHFLPN